MSHKSHLILGRKGESLAAAYLKQKGYTILHRNWRHRHDEIDLIAKHDKMLVMVEVKTRSTNRFGNPEESVTPAKQAKLVRAAEAYLEASGYIGEMRFDVVAIIIEGSTTRILHIIDAFYPFISG